MRRAIYAISSAAIVAMLACATSNAAPIAPSPTAIVGDSSDITQVGYYYHGHYYPGHVYHVEAFMHGLTIPTMGPLLKT